jgi:uncharacterized protein (UPF0212 family)
MTSTSTTDWYEVSFSVPWIVHGAPSGQDAINIAVSELGKRVSKTNGSIRNADISVQSLGCSDCGTETEALLVVSGTALVGLLLTVEVRAPSPETSEKIGRRQLGPHMPNTPLKTVQSPVEG